MMTVGVTTGSDVRAGLPQPLFKRGLTSDSNNRPFDVTNDGQRFLVPIEVNSPQPAQIAVMFNWPARVGR